MVFNGTFIGLSTFLTEAEFLPQPSSYTGVRFNGQLILDNVHIINNKLTEEEFNAIPWDNTPTWTGNTIILSTFENQDLNAGNIGAISENILGFNLLRKASGDTKFTQIDTVADPSASQFIDYTANNRMSYSYDVVGYTENFLAEPLEGSITTDFDFYYLIDPTESKSYRFCLEVNPQEINTNDNVSVTTTMGQYPTVTKGNNKFRSSSVVAIAEESIDVNGEIVQPVSYIEELEETVNNTNSKIFKTPKGEVFRVQTQGFRRSVVNRGDNIQVQQISFTWVEIADVIE